MASTVTIEQLKGSTNKVRVQQVASPAQSISTATFTKVAFGTENEDPGGLFATGTFTAPYAGHLLVAGSITWQAFGAAAAQVISEIYKNGAAVARMSNQGTGMGNQPSYNFARVIPVAASDTIEIYVYQNSGGSVSLETGLYTAAEFAYLP